MMMPSWLSRASALAIAATVAVIALMLLLSQCEKNRNQAAQGRMEREQAGAAANSAADAIGTVQGAGNRETASEELTRNNERDIRNAQGAQERVNPAVDVAGRRSICLRDAYRDDPKCKLFRTPPN